MKKIYNKFLLLLLLLPFCVLAQITVKGVVLDKSTGQPIPGVNIKVSQGNLSMTTDFDGKFVFNGLKEQTQITFSFTGFTTQVITVGTQRNMTVTLEEDPNLLQEVVVQVGYGSVKKKDATGSVVALTTKDFNKGNNITPESLLNGRVAGLTINSSGAPGSLSEIRIRGGSSLFASNDPLIVIDGLPVENTTNVGSASFLGSLNPATIESMTILKDASATAIYGSRASNGVIIITTKKGSNTLSVDYNAQYSAGKLTNTVDVFSADEFRKLIADRRPQDVGKLGTANTDWQKAIYRNTNSFDQSLAVRGSLFNIIPTSLTLGNTNQEGLRITNEFKRNTVGLVMNPSFLENTLKVKLSANYAYEKNRFTDAVEGTAIGFDPTQPIRVEGAPYDGFFEYLSAADSNGNYPLNPNAARNPVSQLLNTRDIATSNRFFGNFEVDYKLYFFPDVRAVVNVGFDESNGERTRLVNPNAGSGPTLENFPYGTNEYTDAKRQNKLLDAYLVYNKTFDSLIFELTGGYSYQRFESSRFETGNILNPNLASTFPETTIDTETVLIGFFARTNLNFRDKYLLTLSYRRDGSSRFDEENRWGNFPSVAFGWKLKEDFFKDSKTLSDLKLRLSYGITGQQDIPEANGYLQKYESGTGNSQYYIGNDPVTIALPYKRTSGLKWEETTTYNAGIDFGFLENRISASLDMYYKDSKDLLANVAIPDGSNFSNRVYQNIGRFSTKGVELTVNANAIKTENYSWNVNFNASKFERRIDELANNADIFLGDNITGNGSTSQIFREGYSPYSFYVYKQLYDTAGKPIDGAFADLNGDNIKNDADKYIYNNPDPDFTLGFASNMNYKKFDFYFNLRASIGNNIFNGMDASRAQYNSLFSGGVLSNIPTQVKETNFQTTENVVMSDIYVENASFLKMDNISLGYTFDNVINEKVSLRLSTGIQNVFVITKYSGLDPEITNNGVDKTIYPRQRTFLFGANLKF
ncbi:SusC/RagA family TonB-linked outer membrane protein [Flavobacterium sp. DGU38]|uniref:SusC/RagA family TonB-linked outer membrane protein n=1 Tax=Flavobacterium calami TaxID=3139144 RepID=A0ABU9ISC3_9FLAO